MRQEVPLLGEPFHQLRLQLLLPRNWKLLDNQFSHLKKKVKVAVELLQEGEHMCTLNTGIIKRKTEN